MVYGGWSTTRAFMHIDIFRKCLLVKPGQSDVTTHPSVHSVKPFYVSEYGENLEVSINLSDVNQTLKHKGPRVPCG